MLSQARPNGDGTYLYRGSGPGSASGAYRFSIRVLATHPQLQPDPHARPLTPPLFPSRAVPNSIASPQCAPFTEKSRLATGGSLPGSLRCLPPRRSPSPSSVIPSRGDEEGPPLWSDHPSSFTSSHPD